MTTLKKKEVKKAIFRSV